MAASTHAVPVYAAVELGSDSFRLIVAAVEHDAVRILTTLEEPVRLGAAIGADGCLGAESMRRALACLRGFKASLAPWEPLAVRAVATAALRVACNAPAFLPAACAALGHPIDVVGAEEEGRLVYLGVAGALDDQLADPQERRLVLDIGSGSTEVVVGRGAEVELVQSFGVGALRQGLAFFGDGISAGAFAAALASSRSRVADAASLSRGHGWRRAYGASGTLRALAELAGEGMPGEPVLDSAGLQGLRRALIDEGGLVRAAAQWPQPGRAVQLAGGLALLLALVDELRIGALVPVQAGLRAGVIRDLHRRTQAATEPCAPYRECV
jgi:exopolyphosphatase/guanosine-5'-triphosphate,3'-diphosphate pyrophosphatase